MRSGICFNIWCQSCQYFDADPNDNSCNECYIMEKSKRYLKDIGDEWDPGPKPTKWSNKNKIKED